MAVEISQGVCDLCGAPSDASLQECNWLTCTYQHCEGGLYHQECLEKYLKSNKLEKNRKTGFKCPRGCGKGTRFDQACPGRIDKSHPIHPRNEDKKKTKLAAVVVEPQRPAKPAVPTLPNGKAAKPKEESKADAAKDVKGATPAKAPVATKPVAAAASVSPPTALGQKAVRKDAAAAALPPRPEVVAKQKLAELAAQARREIGLPSSSSSLSTHGSKGDLQGLASSVGAGSSKSLAPPAPSAWGKPASSAAEPPPISPQPTMMSQLPQFQQLLQQAVGKKQTAKSTLAGSASVPVPAASKPTPAVPQPVTPPTPVWPALGTSQASAASLFSSSSNPIPQTPREGTPRPGSPPSAWGGSSSTAGSAASSSLQQQATAQQPAQQAATTAPSTSAASASRPHAGAGGGASASSATAGPSPASAAAAAGPTSSATPATAAAGAAATAAVSSAQGCAASMGSSGAASSSGRTSASELQPAASSSSAAAAAAPAGPATAAAGGASRGGSQLVGADFDDDGKEPKLTKAQKKNLKRTEKKKSPLGGPGDQQQGAGDGSAGQETASEAPSRGSLDGVAGAASSRQSAGGAVDAGRQASDVAAASSSGCGAAGAGSSSNGAASHRRHASRGSDDPEPTHIAEAEDEAVMEELCINCIVARKVLALITSLQRLGALEFVAAAAVQRHGSNLLAALEWLLVAGADAAAAQPEAVLAAAAESASAAESEVDISEELQQLSDLQAAMGVTTELLQQCVLDCNGDVQTAANTAMERMLSEPPSAAGAGTAAAAAARRGGRASSGSGQTANGPTALRGSPSFYSVSSLEGGAASGADSDAAASVQPKPAPPQHQVRSSHFGVRLQDEPAGCNCGSSGGGAGYGVGDEITAGFLRGGVVLGAAGWPNGYLRESPPPPGFAPGGGGAATAASSGGRSTSRLLHWLREEPGRAAGLAEEQASGEGGHPVVDSPFSAHGNRSGAAGAAREGGGEGVAPSFGYWLGSNGYHPHHQHHSAAAAGAAGLIGTGPAGMAGRPYMYCGGGGGEVSNGDFSFVSALSKPPSLGESLGGYGSRWTSMGASEGSRQDAPGDGRLLFGGAAAEAEGHGEGDSSDLNSILLSCQALRP